MDPGQFTGLPEAISAARLAPYLTACDDDVQCAVRLYTWNIEVSSAFWGPVHVFEVVLRNALHNQMSRRYGRSDWWERTDVRLHDVMVDQLDRAQQDARKAASRKKRQMVPDDIVAALSLGFWTGLLGSGRSQQYETQFWQPFLRDAFPNYSGARSALHRDVETLRLFRNRLAHHEPVFTRHLAADHETILRVVGYIASDAAEYVESHSRAAEVLARRQRAVSRGDATGF